MRFSIYPFFHFSKNCFQQLKVLLFIEKDFQNFCLNKPNIKFKGKGAFWIPLTALTSQK